MKDVDLEIRDMIKRASDGQYLQHGSAAEAACVLGLSFGYRLSDVWIQPGESNRDIAAFIEANYHDLPKILQFEVADAIVSNRNIYRIQYHSTPGKYLDTREVGLQARALMKQHKWPKAILVAHPNHIPRADAICQRLGIATVVPQGLSVIRFDPESEQAWTRDVQAWADHEANSIPYAATQGWV